MGNSSTNHFPSESWTFDHRSDFYDICRSSRGVYAEKHVVPNNPKIQAQDQMEVYNFRNKTNKPIVHVYDAEYEKADNTCGKQKNIHVYSEYIPHRLSDTRNLTHGQGMYVMSQALYGFEELHHRFGGFPITDDHIGFNDEGEVRVWHSPNFGSNHLYLDGITLMSTHNPRNFDERMQKKQQQQMVEDIWFSVQQHANMRRDFGERAGFFRDMDFDQARRFINEQITRSQDYVPDHLSFRDARRYGNQGNYGSNYGNQYERGGYSRYEERGRFGGYQDSRVLPYQDRHSGSQYQSGNREFRNSRYRSPQYGMDNNFRGSRASNYRYEEGQRYPERYNQQQYRSQPYSGSQVNRSHASNQYNESIIHNAAYRTENDY